jgi:Co/Zn/Cd efflux system component
VLGALINSVFLISLSISIFIEAVKRCIEKKDLKEVNLMLYVSCTGLAINLIGLVIFGHGHSHSVPTQQFEELEEFNKGSDDYVSISNNAENDSLGNGKKNVENKVTQHHEFLLDSTQNQESRSKKASFPSNFKNI